MGIDKHLILTLERSEHRQWAVLGGSTAMQTPSEKIHFVKGHDNKDYQDDMRKIADAAEADEFPYVHYFARGLKNSDIGQSASGVCQVWNYSRILKYIALGTETCLITWDDRILTLPFPLVDRITTELQRREEEFYFLQLRIRMGDAYDVTPDIMRICKLHPELLGDADRQKLYFELMDRDFMMFADTLKEKWALDFENFRMAHFNSPEIFTSPEDYVKKYLQKNHLGYDESFIISPKGAAWLLLQAFEMEDLDPDNETEDTPYWETVIHRRNTFDTWMVNDLGEPVKKAIDAGKGIYCPADIGFKYIHDWLPMGSSVEWSNASNAEIEEIRTRTSEINFLEIP